MSIQRCDDLVDASIETEVAAGDSNARSFQAIRIKECRVIRQSLAFAGNRIRVIFIDTSHSAEQYGGIGNPARHRTGSVLGVGDGNDTRTTNQTQGWFEPDDPIGVRWTYD